MFKYGPAAKSIEGHVALNIDDNFAPIVDGNDPNPAAPLNNKASFVSWTPSSCKWGHGWRMDKEDENFDAETFVYLEMRSKGIGHAQARQTLIDWLGIAYNQTGPAKLYGWTDDNINNMRGLGGSPRQMVKRKGGLKGKT